MERGPERPVRHGISEAAVSRILPSISTGGGLKNRSGAGTCRRIKHEVLDAKRVARLCRDRFFCKPRQDARFCKLSWYEASA